VIGVKGWGSDKSVRAKELEGRIPAKEGEEARRSVGCAVIRLTRAGWGLANTGQNSRKEYSCQFISLISFEWSGKTLKRLLVRTFERLVAGVQRTRIRGGKA